MESLELLIKAHEQSRNAIHLIASESWLEQEARLPYLLDVYSRYIYDIDDEDTVKDENGLLGQLPSFGGTEYLNKLESSCNKMLCDLLDAKYSCVKAISGLNMMISVLGSLVMKNETICSLPVEAGGHSATKYVAERIGLQHKFIPFIPGTFEIDRDAFKLMVQDIEVKMIYIDLMNVINTTDIACLRDIVGKKTIICYDASHVLGLILGDQFQNPLKEGADILIGSTHKTFPGPHKGIFVTNNRWYHMLYKLNHVLFISHTHIGDTASLALMLEKGKIFYQNYAKHVVDNAKALAGTMIENGLTVYFQSSHQVWIDCGNINITEAINECLNNGIYVNSINIPHNHYKGIRIGVQEVTYHGFGEKEMFELGKILSKIFKSRKLNLYDKSILKDLIDKQNEDKDISMYNLYNLLERCFGAKKSLIKSTP